jgi:hypothetical protein
MLQELLHFFSFILCAAGLGVAVIGILLAVCALTTPLIRHKVMTAVPFISMILGGSLGTYLGWKGINSIPTPKRLEIQAPADSVIRAEVIRNGQVIHKEEI